MFPLAGIVKVELEVTAVAVPPNHAASLYLALYVALSDDAAPLEEENFKCVSNFRCYGTYIY